MISLFKKRNKETLTDGVSRSKYYLEKELLLKGIIYEEKELEAQYKEVEEVVPRSCLVNRINSPFYKLVSDLKTNYNKSELFDVSKFMDNEGKVAWGKLIHVKKTKELNDVFVDSMSTNLNVKEVEEYQEILKEQLIEARGNLGVYKASWGYMTELNRRFKELKTNIEFLKKNNLYRESKMLRIDLVLEFDYFGSGTIDIYRQYFKVDTIGGIKSITAELNAKDCLKLVELRNWGTRINQEIEEYRELSASGIQLGKEGGSLFDDVHSNEIKDSNKLEVN
jgi:hypothetical protein